MFVFFIPSNSFVANKKSLFMWLFALFAVLTVAFRVYYIVINASVLEPTFNAVVNSLNNISPIQYFSLTLHPQTESPRCKGGEVSIYMIGVTTLI